MVQQHQRQQPGGLLLIAHVRKLPSEPDRFGSQIHISRVALVEDQVEHAPHRCQIARFLESHTADGLLGTADPLCHRRFGDEVGRRDLLGRQTSDGAQRERHRRRRGQ